MSGEEPPKIPLGSGTNAAEDAAGEIRLQGAALMSTALRRNVSILSLVLPLGVLIVVVIWYSLRWRRGAGER